MKVIPVYLPQFHQIPENDDWWGEGFTEWVNVKNAKPLFEGHKQPRVPRNKNYYDLSEVDTLRWQCRLAREHNIFGFCMYHYWFNGKLLLNKPMELLLENTDIDINYCISWANHDWTDTWRASAKAPKTLISHNFEDEADWLRHFEYFLPFFKDTRYMSEGNKPILVIYIPHIIKKLSKMLDLWDRLAVEAGFDGLTFIYQSAASVVSSGWDRSRFKYGVETNPGYINLVSDRRSQSVKSFAIKHFRNLKQRLGIKRNIFFKEKTQLATLDYNEIWAKILRADPLFDNMIPSAFVDWDNTPRHKLSGSVYMGASPEKFKIYFRELVTKARHSYPTDMIFVFAWNEWAEGGYLEPDEDSGLGYLEAISSVLSEFSSDPEV